MLCFACLVLLATGRKEHRPLGCQQTLLPSCLMMSRPRKPKQRPSQWQSQKLRAKPKPGQRLCPKKKPAAENPSEPAALPEAPTAEDFKVDPLPVEPKPMKRPAAAPKAGTSKKPATGNEGSIRCYKYPYHKQKGPLKWGLKLKGQGEQFTAWCLGWLFVTFCQNFSLRQASHQRKFQ